MPQRDSRHRLAAAVLITLALAFGLTGLPGAPAHAATITVSNWSQFRSAIIAANADTDVDTIVLAGNSADYVNSASESVPSIMTPIHIVGPGSGQLTIDLNFNTLTIYQASEASVTGVSFTRGGVNAWESTNVVIDDIAVDRSGNSGVRFSGTSGAIRNSVFVNVPWAGIDVTAYDSHAVEVRNITIRDTGHLWDDSSGLVITARDGARVVVSDVTVTDADNRGAFIHAQNTSTVEVTNLTVTGNPSHGLEVVTQGSAQVTVTDATSTGNDEHGIRVTTSGASSTHLHRAVADNNEGVGMSLGVGAGSVLHITDSQSSGNTLGGFDVSLTAGANNGTVSISGSSVSDNDGPGLTAVGLSGAMLTLVNSTISGNTPSPTSCSGGLDVSFSSGTHLEVSHTTVFDNTATGSCAAANIAAGGDAVISHTVFAGAGTRDLAVVGTPSSLTLDYNFVQSTGGDAALGALLAAGTGNLVGLSPLLGPLADNGGPTLTHLPQAGSPLFDAGVADPALLPATDQRGEARLVGAAVDLGSVESPTIPAIVSPGLAATGVEEESVLPLVAGGGVLLLLGGALIVYRIQRGRSTTR